MKNLLLLLCLATLGAALFLLGSGSRISNSPFRQDIAMKGIPGHSGRNIETTGERSAQLVSFKQGAERPRPAAEVRAPASADYRAVCLKDLDEPHLWRQAGSFERNDTAFCMAAGTSFGLRHSSTWKNMEIRSTVRLSPWGRAVWYTRRSNPFSCIRFLLDRHSLCLQERHGPITLTLRRLPVPPVPSPEYSVRFRVKENRAWAWLDGTSLLAGHPLTRTIAQGETGWEVLGGTVEMLDLHIAPLRGGYVMTDSYRALPASIKESAHAVLLTWFRGRSIPEISTQMSRDIQLAEADGVEVIPVIEVASTLAREPAEALADCLVTVLNRLELTPSVRTIGVRGGGGSVLAAALFDRGRRVLLIASPQEAAQLEERGSLPHDARFLLDGIDADTFPLLARILQVMPPDRLIVRPIGAIPLPEGVSPALWADDPQSESRLPSQLLTTASFLP